MAAPPTDALAAALPLAVAAAAVAGLGSRRVGAGVLAGLLALLACARALAAAPPLGPPDPTRLLELVVPGLLARAPDGATGLPAAAWLGSPAAGAPLDVGLAGLAAAALGLAAAPGVLAWIARLGLAAAAVGLSVAAPLGLAASGLLAQASLAALAGLGLAAVTGGHDDDRRGPREGPLLLVGGLAVLLAGALAVAAVSAGASDPRELMAPFVDALPAQAPSPPVRDAAAARLVARLDRAALASFAAMGALLLLLRSRHPWAALPLAGLAVVELLWH